MTTKGKTMHAATKRTIIAAAGLAAAGLFAALPNQGPQALQSAPTVHRDVALVDDSSTILPPETSFDTELFSSVLGSSGAEEQLFNALGPIEGPILLDTFGASPAYSGDFNGAETSLFDGLFIDQLVGEDLLNQALGVTAANSHTAILDDLGPLVSAATIADLLQGTSSSFDSTLIQVADTDYGLASTDFEGYLEYLATLGTSDLGLGDLGSGLTGLLGDLGSGGLGSLGGDLTTILGDLTGGLL
jgi:hypothetical protein